MNEFLAPVQTLTLNQSKIVSPINANSPNNSQTPNVKPASTPTSTSVKPVSNPQKSNLNDLMALVGQYEQESNKAKEEKVSNSKTDDISSLMDLLSQYGGSAPPVEVQKKQIPKEPIKVISHKVEPKPQIPKSPAAETVCKPLSVERKMTGWEYDEVEVVIGELKGDQKIGQNVSILLSTCKTKTYIPYIYSLRYIERPKWLFKKPRPATKHINVNFFDFSTPSPDDLINQARVSAKK